MIKTHCRWFCYFRYGNFYVQVGFRSGRPSTEEVDEIVAEVEQHQHTNSHHIANEVDIHYQTLLNHLKRAPIKNRFDILGATRKDAQEFSLSCLRLRNFT